MRIRSDGEETRKKILDAACLVFGEKGYSKATLAAIAQRAGVKAPLISFHFRSKDDLYRIVWNTLEEKALARWPVGGGLADDAPPTDRLRAHIHSSLNRCCDPELSSWHRIHMQERVSPTGFLEEEVRNRFREHRRHMRGVLKEILGDGAAETEIDLCEMSIVNQFGILRRPGHPDPASSHLPRFTAADVDRLTDHITRFCLGGLAAVRKAIAERHPQ